MEVIKETKNYIVVNKAPGEDSEHDIPRLLAEALKRESSDFLCIHRLDKTAGGLLVYGKNKAAAADLTKQLQAGTLKKSYLAIVPGVPEQTEGVLKDLLYKDKTKQKMFPVKRLRKGVKEAVLSFKVAATKEWEGNVISLLEISLQTGRFHQIRCQFASRGLPLLGDGKYGSRIKTKNLSLFCRSLSFYDSIEKTEVFFSAFPPEEEPWTYFETDL
ncbi:MAG: RluA family pseudouridine synthase [Oribacterium sp.]|nr:RluA family pseudouridine synthase [Oribacterium sp.]